MKIYEIVREKDEQNLLVQEPDPRQHTMPSEIIHPQQPQFQRNGTKQIPIYATPQFQTWFRGSKIVDKAGRPLRVYHGTQSPEDFDNFAVGGNVSTEDDLYHRSGSGADPRTFLGSHFAAEPDVASKFAVGLYGEREHTRGEGGRVMPVYLRIINPYRTSDSALFQDMIQGSYNSHTVDWALDIEGSNTGEDPDELAERYDADPAFRAEINNNALSLENEDHDFELAEEMAADYRNKLMQAGYDGVVYKNEIEGGTSYIIFDPRQVKSALNTGSFNPENPDISETKNR